MDVPFYYWVIKLLSLSHVYIIQFRHVGSALCWENKKATIKQALFSTSQTQQTTSHKEVKVQSIETAMGDKTKWMIKNCQIKKWKMNTAVRRSLNVRFNYKLEDRDGLLSDKNVAMECSGVYHNPNRSNYSFFFSRDGTAWIRKMTDCSWLLST